MADGAKSANSNEGSARRFALGGMVPDAVDLPDVLPTDRLLANGVAVRPVRTELRQINNLLSAAAVIAVVAEPILVIGAAIWLSHPVSWIVAFLWMGPVYARFASLGHEAVHRTLFSNRKMNDAIGRWVLSYPTFVPFELYRRSHINHHRDEMGPKEPDIPLYAGYPVTKSSLRRKLIRDATGRTGWPLFKGLLRGLRKQRSRPAAVRIVAAQVVVLAAMTAVGRPELYLLLWWLPYMTVWRVINRLRAIAEHAGMERSSDRRRTTHHIRQSIFSQLIFAPFNIGYHLAHHVDMGVPCWKLPALQRELDASGWITEGYTWPSYRKLWSALASASDEGSS